MPISSYKGYYGIMKGIVTRTDDPEENENDGRKRIQVCIPSYHGDIDESKKGSGSDLGSYPWAQVCSNMFNGGSSNTSNNNSGFFSSIMSALLGTSSNNTSSISMLYPAVGDVVWLMFEGGDIRCPIYMGSLSPNTENQLNLYSYGNNGSNSSLLYTSNGTALRSLCLKMILEMSGVDYDTISNIN